MLSALSPAEWQHYLPCMCAGSGGLSAFVSANEGEWAGRWLACQLLLCSQPAACDSFFLPFQAR